MNKDIQEMKNRLQDLAWQSYINNRFTFTEFLSESELAQCLKEEYDIPDTRVMHFGGYEEALRQVIRFGNPRLFGYDQEYPITILHVAPVKEKFADELTHRDILGALMNLGMERKMLGDILVKEIHAYVCCITSMAEFICENLTRVKHTTVTCTPTDGIPEELRPHFEEQFYVLPSDRLDCLVAKLTNLSRMRVRELFEKGDVIKNSMPATMPDFRMTYGDIISVRGYGRWKYEGPEKLTHKGKLRVRVLHYC